MPYWGKFVNDGPRCDNTGDANFIEALVEPIQLQFYAKFPKEELHGMVTY